MSWKEIELGNAIHVKHGFAFKGEYFANEGNFIVLTPGNFYEEGGFRARPGKDRFYASDVPDSYILDENDLIVAMTEQGAGLLGSSALVPDSNRYLHNQRIGLVDQINEEVLDRFFLYYLFNTRDVRGQISGSASGTKVRHTAPERIYRVRARVPEVTKQKAIAQTLKVYDDLIINSKRRIELLEQSARLLFQEWFIRLRYPGHEHDKVVRGVPEGWSRPRFSDLAEFINGFAFKPHHWGNAGLPIVKIPELKDGIGSNTPKYSGSGVSDKYKICCGDLLFSWSGTLAVEFWVEEDAYLNQHLFLVKPYGCPGAAFLLLALRDSIPAFMSLAVGATMKHIRRSALDELRVLVPPEHLLVEFETEVNDIYSMVVNLRRQNNCISRARGLLLPRLMDGRVTV